MVGATTMMADKALSAIFDISNEWKGVWFKRKLLFHFVGANASCDSSYTQGYHISSDDFLIKTPNMWQFWASFC